MHTDSVSAQLYRLNWLLRARVVEAKLRELKRAVKAGFDPNQPRVPCGQRSRWRAVDWWRRWWDEFWIINCKRLKS